MEKKVCFSPTISIENVNFHSLAGEIEMTKEYTYWILKKSNKAYGWPKAASLHMSGKKS